MEGTIIPISDVLTTISYKDRDPLAVAFLQKI